MIRTTIVGLKAMQMQLIMLLLIALVAADQALLGCPNSCGSVSQIPYPFGIGKSSVSGENCFLEETLELTCRNNSLFRGIERVEILNITLDGKMDMLGFTSKVCKDQNAGSSETQGTRPTLTTMVFPISSHHNKFISVGCDTYGYLNIHRHGVKSSTGCSTRCGDKESLQSMLQDGKCTGIGCCQIDVPPGMRNISLQAFSFNNFDSSSEFSNCSYSFLVKNGDYRFSMDHLLNGIPFYMAPFVVEWSVGTVTCDIARLKPDYACKSNSVCEDSVYWDGYRCKCEEGYEGNPYLPDGCKGN